MLSVRTATMLVALLSNIGQSDESPIYQASQKNRDRSDYVAKTRSGAAIATAHPLASEAAAKILRMGGNAADAAVAASFVISVVRPHSTGVGGGGFLIYHDADRKHQLVFDFRERAPAAATRDMYLDKDGNPKDFTFGGTKLKDPSVNGHLSAGVPGLVRGLGQFHKKFGRLKWSVVLKPAVEIAQNGFAIYESLAEDLLERKDVISAYPASKKIFFRGNSPLKFGDPLIQEDLAKTLEEIAKNGPDSFYTGAISKKILAEMKRGGGIITSDDLQNYEVKMRDPIIGSYAKHRIISMPPPSSGGIHIVQMLNIMSEFDLKKEARHSPQSLHLIAETMRRAFADRAELLGDPDFIKIPVTGLLNLSYAKMLAKGIQMNAVTPSAAVKKSEAWKYESPSTTHLSIVDQAGNAVSTTQTINYSFGSCVVVDGTGIILNDEMDDFSIKPGVPNAYGLVGSEANAIAAKKTMLSSMSPSLVLDQSGDVQMLVGSPGGPRIISASFLTILNRLAYNMSPEDAVHALRIHHQWMPDKLRIEKGYSLATINALKKYGHQVEEGDQIGDVQAIIRTKEGWTAVSDTRSEGKPLTVQ